MASLPHWTDVMSLRPEVLASDGGVGELQMSLHKAVYQTVDVPYRDVGYYADITQPTPNMVGFFARIARRLASGGESVGLFHLDQGMGGGKSHALVGLYHMAATPQLFFPTDLGKLVLAEAQAGHDALRPEPARVVTLTADHFSPGKPTELFGPAVNLFERFLWSLCNGDRSSYDAFVRKGSNKSTLQEVLAAQGKPVLILLDELMDYAMALSDASVIDTLPGEQAFLNALMDACDDVTGVAFVVVMIRSELDPEGYTPLAENFRDYIARRLNRNGTTVAVTETGDFAAIIRRRLFEQNKSKLPTAQLAKAFQNAVEKDPAWGQQVFDRMGAGKGITSLGERVSGTYPFHPDLMDLVQDEWSKAQGFQRVRSTVAIFALAALHWSRTGEARDWVPPLIGVGDLPLAGIRGAGAVPQARCLDALLNSGLLLGNDRAIQGYRAVATTDITSADGVGGRAVVIDRRLRESKVDTGQPAPAVRMATALFNYSLVSRGQGRRGATKAELMAALLMPSDGTTSGFATVEEVFWSLTGDEGLGALEVTKPGNAAERYWLTIKQTLRMFFNSAKSQIGEHDALALVWETAQAVATKGSFEELHFVAEPSVTQDLADVTAGMDSQCNRLVVLDPKYWTLLNGEDSKARIDIRRLLGVGGQAVVVDNAASCVIAAVNTYQRRYAVQAAQEVLTWRFVAAQAVEDEERADVQRKLGDAELRLKERVRGAYRQYAYLVRRGEALEVVFAKVDDERLTALNGNDVWGALVGSNRAVGEYTDPVEKRRKRTALSETFVALLLDKFDRHLTLKDVLSSFYRDPRFPLVPTLDEIRQVVFNLLQPVDHAGVGTGGWELVGSDGSRLHVESPKQLAISSIQQQLRRVSAASDRPVVREGEETPPYRGEDDRATSPVAGQVAPASSGHAPRSEPPLPGAVSFSWYRVEMTNRSIAEEARREVVRAHLIWLASKLDDDSLQHQLISLRYELMAGSHEEFAAELRRRAEAIQANKIETEEDV